MLLAVLFLLLFGKELIDVLKRHTFMFGDAKLKAHETCDGAKKLEAGHICTRVS